MNTELGRESDGTYFFCVKDSDGCLNHTTVAMDEEYTVEQFLKVECTMNELANCARASKGMPLTAEKSWEQWESEGYSIAAIRIVEIPAPASLKTP